ncbi:MAG: GNAT family N-acetyltransferase [Candidatus Bathyarchaeota archaeon]|nr:GNAT family N-acetyltransferase [Candidatus Bathyarchaeota archaeon]
MICKVSPSEFEAVLGVVNDAAQAYKGVIPPDCWREPYMTPQELKAEITRGVELFCFKENNEITAVMGIERFKDVTLIRHAYTLTRRQKQGIGKKLLLYLLGLAKTPIVFVGTWEAAWWATRFYEKNGFVLVSSRQETDRILQTYWCITMRQVETSVVLKLNT